jgi:hypothetical protein
MIAPQEMFTVAAVMVRASRHGLTTTAERARPLQIRHVGRCNQHPRSPSSTLAVRLTI